MPLKSPTTQTMKTNLTALLIGLTAGNFFMRAVTDQDWNTAIERSFFQFVALLCVWIMSRHNH